MQTADDRINAQMSIWLQQIKSSNAVTRRKAINGIWEIVAPPLLIDGYGRDEDWVRLVESPFPEAVISPLGHM